MGLRFRKSFKILPGVKINFNKKTNIEDEEIKSFSAGNHKLPPVDVQKIIRVVSF